MIRRLFARAVLFVLLAVVVVAAIFPVYWMLVTASLEPGSIFRRPPALMPQGGFIDTARNMIRDSDLLQWLTNTTVIASGTAIISVAMACLAAYALSRFRFFGRGAFGFALFATQMLPEALLIVPLYAIFLTLGLLNGLLGLVLINSAIVMPVLAWILKTAIDSVPYEIEEAAIVDGCRRLTVLGTIVIPIILPSLAAAAVIAFFHGWDEFLFASTFLEDRELWPASVGLASLVGETSTAVDQIMAGSLIYTVPAVIFFLFAQKRVVSGLAAGSVKG